MEAELFGQLVSTETRFLHAIEMGLGAWAWGDRVVWQYGRGYRTPTVRQAFLASIAEGIRLIDTAEVYGGWPFGAAAGSIHSRERRSRCWSPPSSSRCPGV